MTNRSGPPAPGRALQALLDRIAAADLDPVQIASMDLHLSHVLRLRKEWVPASADRPRLIIGEASRRHGEGARS